MYNRKRLVFVLESQVGTAGQRLPRRCGWDEARQYRSPRRLVEYQANMRASLKV